MAVFYIAEVILALQYLHSKGINVKLLCQYLHSRGINVKLLWQYLHSRGINAKLLWQYLHSRGINAKLLWHYLHSRGIKYKCQIIRTLRRNMFTGICLQLPFKQRMFTGNIYTCNFLFFTSLLLFSLFLSCVTCFTTLNRFLTFVQESCIGTLSRTTCSSLTPATSNSQTLVSAQQGWTESFRFVNSPSHKIRAGKP